MRGLTFKDGIVIWLMFLLLVLTGVAIERWGPGHPRATLADQLQQCQDEKALMVPYIRAVERGINNAQGRKDFVQEVNGESVVNTPAPIPSTW